MAGRWRTPREAADDEWRAGSSRSTVHDELAEIVGNAERVPWKLERELWVKLPSALPAEGARYLPPSS